MVSQVWTQEETWKKLRKTKFILGICPRNRRHDMPQSTTWENTSMGQEAERIRARGVPRPLPLLGFLRERQDRTRKLV